MILLLVTIVAIYAVGYGGLWLSEKAMERLLRRHLRLRELQLRSQVLQIELRALRGDES
jgi:uncharacterized protein YneF (UPF0154 family)